MFKPRLQEKYFSEVIPFLKDLFGYKYPMQVSRLDNICINQGLGDGISKKN